MKLYTPNEEIRCVHEIRANSTSAREGCCHGIAVAEPCRNLRARSQSGLLQYALSLIECMRLADISKLVRRAGTRAERELWEHARTQISAPIWTWMLLTTMLADDGARSQSPEVVVQQEANRKPFRVPRHIFGAGGDGI